MRNLLEKIDWVIRTKNEGENFDNSKSAEKFKWFSVILEFIQNAVDANRKYNQINKKDEPVLIKINFKKISASSYIKNFLTKKFKKVLSQSRFKPQAQKEFEGQENIDTLILEDFNTTGILGDHRKYSPKLDNGDDNPIFRFNFFVGDDTKMNDPDAGGSEGEGRQTFYFASKISTFLYYTKRVSEKPLIYGMTFVGKTENPDDIHRPWVNVLKFGEKIDKLSHIGDLSYAIPMQDDECNEMFKKIVPITRNDEPGTSIAIPFYERRYLKKDRVILKVIDVYRVQIIRGQMIIDIDGERIDSSSIEEVYKKYFRGDELEKLNKLNYFKFIKEVNNSNDSSYSLDYSMGFNLLNEGSVSNLDKLLDDFNKNKVVKLRCNFTLNKQENVSGQYRKEEISKKTHFDLYLKQTDGAYVSKNCNDFIRGEMSIYNERKRLSAFSIIDIQDDTAKLLFKCAEGANHSEWNPQSFKLENLIFFTQKYSDVVSFGKRLPEQMLRLLESKDLKPDFDTLSELFPDLSDEGKEKKKKEKKKEKPKDTPPKIPNIFKKIKNYEIDASSSKDGGFAVKGNIFEKKDIQKKLVIMNDERTGYLKKIKSENDIDKVEIMKDALKTLENRIKEYENFLDDGCDNYPITIQIKMGFEGENLSNPIRNWSDRQFDLDKNNEFKFECEKDVSIKKKSGNTLQLEAKSGNFKFSLKGFHKFSDYDIAVQDKEI